MINRFMHGRSHHSLTALPFESHGQTALDIFCVWLSQIEGKSRVLEIHTTMSDTLNVAFETFSINYTEFHKDLSRFVDQLVDVAPRELPDVKRLPAHMSPQDPDFHSDYVDAVIKKWSFILNVTERILDKIHLIVKDKNWCDNQKKKLQWWISLVKMSANTLKMEAANTVKYRSLSSGIWWHK
ncbi:hypothetical protein Btru_060562 [Bulinus truncatus]|nr:hypothetical protein Btru_060562 [Bulinus truncatus]